MRRAVTLLLLGAVACATQSGQTRTRASYDLGCPENLVQVQEMGGSAYRASGCGRYADYVCAGGDYNGNQRTSISCVREAGPFPMSGPPAAANASAPAPQTAAPTPTCNPPCSPGYECAGVTCVAVCNPPCPSGMVCAQDRSCVPDPAAAPAAGSTAAPATATP